MKRKYSFINLQEGPWNVAAQAVNGIARSGYINNAMRGAAIGGVAGSVGGVVKNALKNDNDPTKRGIIGAAFKGATTGATVGAGAGLAARAMTGRSMSKLGIQKLNMNAGLEAASGKTGAEAKKAFSDRMTELGHHMASDGKSVKMDLGQHMNKWQFGLTKNGNETKWVENLPTF